jgi:3-phenylpropionate/trans-cinnamate dioxygenase ferredoxin reductase subunit
VTDRPTFVIVGASLAGATAATVLRDRGFDGRLVVIGAERLPPYERPGLSKGYLRGEESVEELLVREPAWYEQHEVELRDDVRAERVDPRDRTVVLDDGQTIAFDQALVATGARNRRLLLEGGELEGVMELRTVEDADAIREAARSGGPAVLVGMGFIGAETAASLRQMGVEVTVVEIFETAIYKVLGREAGEVMARYHADHGVKMRFNDTVDRFEGAGRLERVRTQLLDDLEAAFAVVGIGVVPNGEVWPLDLAADGGIPVDATLRTEVPGIWAAGDVASHDHPIFGRLRVEHYDNAIKMGETAARNMLGEGLVHDDPHWFWSDQYDVQVQMVGIAPPDPTVIVRGSYEERSFCAFSLDGGGVLRAVTSIAWPRDVRRSIKLVQQQVRPDPALLADPEFDLRELAAG